MDYVGVAEELLCGVVSTQALEELPVAVGLELDHIVASAHLELCSPPTEPAKFKP